MKKILIRFDDICPTMDWEQWKRAEDLLLQYNVKPLIGVIPDCQDPDLMINKPRVDFWQWLRMKQMEGYTIAMHGYHHTFCSKAHGILNKRINSEFAGLPYNIQYEIIRDGKAILESHNIYTNIFFAPAHSYDKNTVRALSANGFKYVSDGKSPMPYNWHGITFFPVINQGAARIGGKKYYTSIFHAHEWARDDKCKDYYDLKNTLENYALYISPFDNYSKQLVFFSSFMRLYERGYVFWQYNVRPIVVRIVKLALSSLR